MANTSTRRPAARRRPTPAQLKRGYRTWFFKHLRAAVVLLLCAWVVGRFGSGHHDLWWFCFVLFAVNVVLGAINLVAWRGWWK